MQNEDRVAAGTFVSGTPQTGAAGRGNDAALGPTCAPALFTAGLLGATLAARKVPAIVALAWDGPQLAVYSVSLGLGAGPEQVETLAGALALAAGAESCRVARDGGRLLLELAKPTGERRPLRARRLDALTPPSATAVALGITTGGRALWFDLADERNAHVVIGGTTGSGKSVLLRWLLYRLVVQNAAAALRLILVDPKQFELRQFGELPHLLHPVIGSPGETARVLTWLVGELERRAATGQTVPRLLCVIEEVAEVLAQNRTAAQQLARVAQIGRALGVHVIATTQQPGARSLGDALGNFPARILGRVASATLTYGAAGRRQTGADALLGRGDFLLLAAGETTRFQAPLVDGRQLRQLPRVAPVATLTDELPTLVQLADEQRDARGGRGERGGGAGAIRDRLGAGEPHQERLGGSAMKETTTSIWTLVLAGLVLALVVGVGLAVWLLGADRLFVLALVFVGGLVLVGVMVAAAFIVRQWRRSDANPLVEHHYHDGTRTVERVERVIDGRPQPLPQLPAPAQPPLGVFPELLRASYQAGYLGRGPEGETVDASVRDVTDSGEWSGPIRQ